MHSHLVCAIIAALVFSLSSEAKEIKLTCGPPHEFAHAAYTPTLSEESPAGTLVTYFCQFGYVIDGNKRTSQCLQSEDGRAAAWTDPQISCTPRSCGDPGFLENGDLIGTLYTFPNSVNFECEAGYRLIGNKQRFCLASGSWSGRLPRCDRISCDPPKDPENGHLTYTSLSYLSRLQLECDKGYRPDDDTPVYCTADGVWSRTDIQCIVAACDVPQKPEHGNVRLIGSTSRAGSMAVFSCDSDRIADGPTTSKCLDNGQWTFPTPQCLEPCNIPEVENGKIGRYVSRRYSSTQTFTVIPIGTRIEDNEKLFLHCNSGYDPLGISTNWQQRVACSGGKWSEVPFCEPKSCLTDYPDVPNATPVRGDKKHGGTVEYACVQDFKKIKYGDVNCQYGEWKGEKPVCKDTRCAASSLFSTGLDKGSQQFYRGGEHYEVKCLQGYNQVKGPGYNGRFECEDGIWKGAMPPCVAASCTENPPSIEHGRADVTSTSHSAQVKYVCDDKYILMENKKVQCLFGQWTGQPPKCSDSSCYLKDLKNKAYLSPSTESFTNSGDALNVQCNDGFAPSSPLPLCYNGVWSRNEQSPCKEKDCIVEWLPNAEIKEQVLGPKYWNFWAFRYEREVKNVKVPYGTAPSRSATLFLYCDSGYNFQGKGITSSRIMCSEGRWSPDPVCLRPGTKYVPTTKKPITTTTTTTMKTTPRTSTTLRTTMMRMSSTTTSPSTSPVEKGEEEQKEEETTLPIIESTTKKECFCEYMLNDENIVAYTDGQILQVYDRVKNGSRIQFRCKHVGFQHLVGQEMLTCAGCQAWHTKDFPICVNPKQGDAAIVYDSEVTVSVEGVLEILKGQNVRLSCIAVEEAQFPKWTVPHEKGITAVSERMERADDYLYISHLDIVNPTFENDGLYSCAVEKYPSTTLELRVIDPGMRCPNIVVDRDVVVTYSEVENRVGSTASFLCQKDGYKLTETEELICTRTGEWSRVKPQCVPITCEEFKGTDLMQISYTDEQNVGSFANFHCFAPGRPKGVGRTRCLSSGQWQDEPPTCQTQPCEVNSLFSLVPKGITPNTDLTLGDTMPYNSTIELICDDNLALKGNSLAKCGKNSQWIVEEVQCVSGCLPFPTSPKLIITPEKEVYKFGEFVGFACAPGYDLKNEVEKTMCLSSGWSENVTPQCIESYN